MLSDIRSNWWLSGVASSAYFCNVNNNGNANANNASNANGVRPISAYVSALWTGCPQRKNRKGDNILPHKGELKKRCVRLWALMLTTLLPIYERKRMAELFDKFTSATALYDAFQKAKKESDWKASVQRFEMSILQNVFALQKELRERTYKQHPFVSFTLHERGKTRLIKAVSIRDRVVQRSLCENVLDPILQPKLIHDNGASVEGKGIAFTRRRLVNHLAKFIRKHGTNGYILKIDFSKFFDNIDHDIAINALRKHIDDPDVLDVTRGFFDAFKIDVSDLEDTEIGYYKTHPIDLLDLKESKGGKQFLNRSLGIGSQVSQIIGIYHPTPIDFYCKTKKRCKFYGRYMDDIYIIHESKEHLAEVLEGVRKIAKELRLFISDKKTRITPLSQGFRFLKVRYDILPSGRILRRLDRDSFVRERRRLHTYRRLLDEGRITRLDVSNFYQSYKGQTRHFATHRSVRNLDSLYTELFVNN